VASLLVIAQRIFPIYSVLLIASLKRAVPLCAARAPFVA
jgi:hypothetical protein